jgi:hypothetical protein
VVAAVSQTQTEDVGALLAGSLAPPHIWPGQELEDIAT